MAINPDGATRRVIITADADLLPADMPDAGNTFKWDFVADEALGINWEGGIPDFVTGLQPDLSDLRVGAIGDDWTLANAYGVHQFSQAEGAGKLVISGVAKAAYPLSSSVGTQFGLWRGCTDVLGAENKAGVVPVADGFAGYWPLEEQNPGTAGGGAIYADWTSNANTGLDYVSNTGKAGQIGNGQQLDGVNDYIGIGTPAAMSSFCLSLWLKRSSASGIHMYFTQGTDQDAGGYRILAVDSTIYYIAGANAGGYIVTGSLSDTTSWHNLVMTYSGGVLTAYKDGVQEGTSNSGSYSPASLAAYIGRQNVASYYYYAAASMDEVRIHNVARSANWITSYYNMTSANGAFWSVGVEQAVGIVVPRFINPGFNAQLNPGVN